MKTVIINTFDGGQAEDIRTFKTNQNNGSKHFDIYSNPHQLRPFSDMVADTISTGSTTMTDFDITDVLPVDFSGTVKLVGWGRESAASTKATFFLKSAPITGAWASVVTTAGSTTPIAGTLIEYKGGAYSIDSQPNLIKFTSGTTYTSIGSLDSANSLGFYPKPFVHPEDNIMYIGTNNNVGSYNGTTLDTSVLILPSNMTITSFTNYGGYLAIACKPTSGVGRSIVYLWSRDPTDVFVQPIDWGDGSLEILENINETLVGVSSIKVVGTFDSITNYNYQVKTYSGGSVQVVNDTVTTNTNVLRHFKAKQYDKLYFGFDTDDTIWVTGKNKSGEWFVSKDRYITPTGSTITGVLNNFSLVGDKLFTAYTDGGVAGYLALEKETTWSTSTPSFVTTINPNMPIEHRYEKKKLVAVQIVYEINVSGGTSSGTVGLLLSIDNSTLTSVISKSQSAVGQYVTHAQEYASGLNFGEGYEFYFQATSTGAVRIKEIKYKYEIVNTI